MRELFANPAHVGDLRGGDVGTADEQGIRLRLSALHDQGRIRVLRFRAYGCPHVIAACEWFCSSFEGRAAAELEGFHVADIMRKLSVPVEKTGRILVLEDAVRSLGRRICGKAAANDS